ncbi:tRNA (adenosine(37)-N6)-threonylcarbamoyltransferase complex dimerization subunit type 1 TsaB [Yunchengibacter salinarum]|uniref:tRNA (adenosine(37)-N6)-threonylcarbamoyltransferase complex dimerization subunit type 1 TsaB n=1 Tax=Yunchengibacter salinarum TaxID=3133399 RepID=UPI0035B5E10A
MTARPHRLILALDTSGPACAAALVAVDADGGGTVLAHRADRIGRGHGDHLLPMLDALMEQADTGFDAMDRLAVVTGPGSFTGVRAALSAARGLALPRRLPVVGLSGLALLALSAYRAAPDARHVLALLPGRGGDVFCQAFDPPDQQGVPRPAGAAANKPATDCAVAANAADLVVGQGATLLSRAPDRDMDWPDVRALAQCAMALDPATHPAEPLYVRPADAARARAVLPIAPRNG